MHCFDIIAYHFDGGVYCPDCADDLDHEDPEVGPVFAENENDEIGSTCGECKACYIFSERGSEWMTDLDGVRWARCESCNYAFPALEPSAKMRLQSLRDELKCPGCLKPMHF